MSIDEKAWRLALARLDMTGKDPEAIDRFKYLIETYEAAKVDNQPVELSSIPDAFAECWKETNGGCDEPSAAFWFSEGWIKARKRELSKDDALAKKIADWVASPEGKSSLEETAKSIAEMLEQSKIDSRIDPELMRKPMTI